MAAVGYTRIAREIAFTLEKKSEKIFESILLNNGVVAALGANGRVKIVRGGNRFDEIVHLGENSTVGHRSKFTQIPSDYQNNFQTAYYGQAVVSGVARVNLVEIDQNASEHKIFDLADNLVEECMKTFPNKVGAALMKTTPTAVDPESIVANIEATAFGSQTSTTGGLVRSSYPTDPGAWQNQYDNAGISDLGAATGYATLIKLLWKASPGGSGINEQPDIGLTTNGVFAKLSGGGDINRRYSVSDKMLKLGWDNILANRCAIMTDRTVGEGIMYCLNTNYLRLQVLGGPKTKKFGNVKTLGDGAQQVQLQVRPAIEADDHLDYKIKMYMVYNLTFGGLRQHIHIANITEA